MKEKLNKLVLGGIYLGKNTVCA